MAERANQGRTTDAVDAQAATDRRSILTIPNVLCTARIIGSGILLAVAWAGHESASFALMVALLVTDWLDGKLAVYLKQRSAIGPVLDSIADLSMYTSVIVAVFLLYPETVARNAPWIIAVASSYVLAIAVGFAKFRRWPSYHARLAKISWLAAAIGFIAIFAGWSDWPARIAAALVTLGNLEGVAITLVLRERKTDIPSIFHALHRR